MEKFIDAKVGNSVLDIFWFTTVGKLVGDAPLIIATCVLFGNAE